MEENYLLIKSAKENAEEAMSKIIEENSGLIWNIVKRFTGRGYPKEDLYQIGCIGLIKAIQRFDFSYNVKMSTYAVPYIMGEIKRFLRDDGPIKISRSIKELNVKIKEIQMKNINEGKAEISISELAKILKASEEDIVMAIDSSNIIESIDEEIYNEGSNSETKIAKISNSKDETNELINKICIKELLETLNERERNIIILRYYKGKTQSEIAKKLGITQVQVSRIEKKVLLSMREKMTI